MSTTPVIISVTFCYHRSDSVDGVLINSTGLSSPTGSM
ncbi:MAG: hypothetical protein ACI92S_001574, partial [Planctomycetaceae bacterium]